MPHYIAPVPKSPICVASVFCAPPRRGSGVSSLRHIAAASKRDIFLPHLPLAHEKVLRRRD